MGESESGGGDGQGRRGRLNAVKTGFEMVWKLICWPMRKEGGSVKVGGAIWWGGGRDGEGESMDDNDDARDGVCGV